MVPPSPAPHHCWWPGAAAPLPLRICWRPAAPPPAAPIGQLSTGKFSSFTRSAAAAQSPPPRPSSAVPAPIRRRHRGPRGAPATAAPPAGPRRPPTGAVRRDRHSPVCWLASRSLTSRGNALPPSLPPSPPACRSPSSPPGRDLPPRDCPSPSPPFPPHPAPPPPRALLLLAASPCLDSRHRQPPPLPPPLCHISTPTSSPTPPLPCLGEWLWRHGPSPVARRRVCGARWQRRPAAGRGGGGGGRRR